MSGKTRYKLWCRMGGHETNSLETPTARKCKQSWMARLILVSYSIILISLLGNNFDWNISESVFIIAANLGTRVFNNLFQLYTTTFTQIYLCNLLLFYSKTCNKLKKMNDINNSSPELHMLIKATVSSV